jgi:integrase
VPRGAAVIPYNGKRGTVYRIKYADADGKQVMETVGAERDGVTRRQAEAELRERLVKVERRGWRKPAPLTFAEYAAVWFDQSRSRRRWRPRTVVQYRSVLKRLSGALGASPIASIRPRDVAAYIATQGKTYGAATVSQDVSVLHDILGSAKREELIDSNAADGAERPKQPRRHWRVLTPAEIARVRVAFTDEQARTMFLTLIVTGVRRHELLNLRWRDVALAESVLRVADSKSEEGIRSIAIPPTLGEALWQHLGRTAYSADDDYVFCHPERGTQYRERRFADQFREALNEASVEGYVRPFHDLRHTSITNEAAAGSSPIALMTKAGHRSMKTTSIYLHMAGVVFPDEAEALERRLLGLSTPVSTQLAEPQPISDD